MSKQNWHEKHTTSLNLGDRLADKVAHGMGSWRFIILQTGFVIVWMLLNIVAWFAHWDAYPFILLNLIFSTQAAYAAPIIMMSQNRQNHRDRMKAQQDYRTNIDAKMEIEDLQRQIARMEIEKIDKIMVMLQQLTPPAPPRPE